jgi:hypothetical protein
MLSRLLRHRNINAIAMPGKLQARKATQAAVAWLGIPLPPTRQRSGAAQTSGQAKAPAIQRCSVSRGPVSLVWQLTTTTIGGCPIADDGRSLIADRGSRVCPIAHGRGDFHLGPA